MTGATARRAAQLCRDLDLVHANLIASRGREATQSVTHLHLHLVPRRNGDALALPWDPRGEGSVRAEGKVTR
ncbi:HIT domain-containing protein [Streptomyces albidoflavus]|uniref:HIT family protein n=1 Tax=Streptomyces albidoflavus TaxID=1886 RepID=UPI00101EFCD6|nr:HIT domain-containing protein [Streptomyces albidoflavus]